MCGNASLSIERERFASFSYHYGILQTMPPKEVSRKSSFLTKSWFHTVLFSYLKIYCLTLNQPYHVQVEFISSFIRLIEGRANIFFCVLNEYNIFKRYRMMILAKISHLTQNCVLYHTMAKSFVTFYCSMRPIITFEHFSSCTLNNYSADI